VLVEENFIELWNDKIRKECKILVEQEISATKLEIKQLRQEVCNLTEKTDKVIGSLAYMSDEYDDYTAKISTTIKMTKANLHDIANLKTKIDNLKQQQITLNQIDYLEQYSRRENLEIHGVPTMRNENNY